MEYQIVFEGAIVGHINFEQQDFGQLQRTTETLELRTQFRGMKALTTRIIEIQEEDKQGQPLRFSKSIEIPNASHQIYADVEGSVLKVRYKRGNTETTVIKKIPLDFLLTEGLRQKIKTSLKDNQPIVFSEWDYDAQDFIAKRINISEDKNSVYKWHATKESITNGNIQEQLLDEDFFMFTSNFNYLGKKLELVRCSGLCNNDHLSALRPLDQQMLDSPYLITDSALKGHIRYEIQMNNADPVETNEQKIRKADSSWIFDICANCVNYQAAEITKPEKYLAANTWMEVNDKTLNSVVTSAIKSDDIPEKKMNKLRELTRKRLEKNPQFAGYASARQAYDNRAGDCTEYALLLATLGRIAGVPTRVVFGLSYSREYFHGRKNAFAPHAWVQAWINGTWHSYDAALDVFDAGHIALKIGDGNPQDFRTMFENFNQLKIVSAQQIVSKRNPIQ